MKTSILVPVRNDALLIPSLLRSLAAATQKTPDVEILFIDNGSTDGSREMIEVAKLPRSRLLSEGRRGFAEALNRGIGEAGGEFFLFLEAECAPDARWVGAMEKALQEADLVVGDTLTRPPKKASPYFRVAAKVFEKHSERTSHAHGHALPWGSAGNLGTRRALFEKAGPFSPEAGTAFDIDWCWRALLRGAKIAFAPTARVKRTRAAARRELLEQFERFGLGEAWLHRTYAFLLSPEDQSPDPLNAGVEAFSRLRHHSEAAKVKSLGSALDEVAIAFANGVRLGFERPHRDCPLERLVPETAVAWDNGPKSTSIFVPGRGLAVLEGKQRQLYRAMAGGADQHELTHLFMKLFKATHHEAEHGVAEFRASLTPGTGGT